MRGRDSLFTINPCHLLGPLLKKNGRPNTDAQLAELSSQLLSKVNARDGPLSKLSPQELVELEKVAIECAQLWRRPSSCVEGRNSRLALWHHSWSRLSERKLAALTTVHNFFIKRADRTTAAERFFGQKPKELFPWLLERLTLLGRPAQKRPRAMPAPYLNKVAWPSAKPVFEPSWYFLLIKLAYSLNNEWLASLIQYVSIFLF